MTEEKAANPYALRSVPEISVENPIADTHFISQHLFVSSVSVASILVRMGGSASRQYVRTVGRLGLSSEGPSLRSVVSGKAARHLDHAPPHSLSILSYALLGWEHFGP